MARTIFLTLLLLNLAALAWIYARGEEKINTGREPLRSKAQLETDRIRLMVDAEDKVSAVSGSAVVSQGAVPKTDLAAAENCHAYTGATIQEAQQIAHALAESLPDARIAATPINMPLSFEIAISGLASRVQVDAKLVELKKRGVKEGAQIRSEEDKRYTLVIESFAERSAAEEALKTLAKKGLASAAIFERRPSPEKAMVEIRGSDAALKKLPEQIALFKSLTATACIVQ